MSLIDSREDLVVVAVAAAGNSRVASCCVIVAVAVVAAAGAGVDRELPALQERSCHTPVVEVVAAADSWVAAGAVAEVAGGGKDMAARHSRSGSDSVHSPCGRLSPLARGCLFHRASDSSSAAERGSGCEICRLREQPDGGCFLGRSGVFPGTSSWWCGRIPLCAAAGKRQSAGRSKSGTDTRAPRRRLSGRESRES